MSTELVKLEFTDEQVKLIKSQIAPKATNDELALFLYQAKRTGLDPLARQIYCLPIGGKMSIQTSIDGFRVVAERSGDYAGQDEPEFIEKDGKIECAKVRVYRWKGEQRYLASVGVAYMSEYKQNSPMWTKMPHTMLAKCAEALALRKAYPQDLSGIYTGDEMAQAATEDVDAVITTGVKVTVHNEIPSDDIYPAWQTAVTACETESALMDLWNGNKATCENDPKIKTMFANRKKELK